MKFLCLPGGYCSSKTFQAQLGPFFDCLGSDGKTSFFITQGTVEVSTASSEFHGFFGPPPNFSFLKTDVMSGAFSMRDFPKRETPEATMDAVLDMSGRRDFSEIGSVLERLIGILDSEGDIDGVLGYSEGAVVATSLLLEEARRQRESGREPRIKCAVLMCGWPPIDPVHGQVMLADQVEELITVPSCHVVGAGDPYLDASIALYNFWDPDQADIFDHGGGHVVPRDRKTCQEIAEVIHDLIQSIEN